jgi:acyl-CoA thioester hydrolase
MSDDASWPYTHSDEIRFADLDVMGHLNNVAFMVQFESARVGYMRALVPSHDVADADGFGVMIAEVTIAYRSPGFFGERVDTRVRPGWLGRTSLLLEFEMAVGERLIADGHGVMVLWDRRAERPLAIPVELRERLIADGATPRERGSGALTKR